MAKKSEAQRNERTWCSVTQDGVELGMGTPVSGPAQCSSWCTIVMNFVTGFHTCELTLSLIWGKIRHADSWHLMDHYTNCILCIYVDFFFFHFIVNEVSKADFRRILYVFWKSMASCATEILSGATLNLFLLYYRCLHIETSHT